MTNKNVHSLPFEKQRTYIDLCNTAEEGLLQMGQEYFDIFKHKTDQYRWDKHIDYLRITRNVSSEEIRTQAIKSLEILRDELGKNFLKNCQQVSHPLFAYLFEKSDESYSWLIQFANTISQLKNTDSNYHKLTKLLQPAKRCHDEGLPFVNIARSYLASGFEVNILPEVLQQKKPDIKVSNIKYGDALFLEVTRPSSETDKRDKIIQNSRSLFKALHLTPPYLEFSCLQKRVLEEQELYAAVNEIISTKEKSCSNDSFEILQNDKIDLAVATTTRIDDLKNWCKANGRTVDFSPLTLDYNDTDKIRDDKIVQECKQLPANTPGILYVQMNPLYFWVADLEKAKAAFQSKLKSFPNVIGIVLFSYIGADTETVSFMSGLDYFGKRMVSPTTSRTLIFFYNNDFSLDISVETQRALYSSFDKF